MTPPAHLPVPAPLEALRAVLDDYRGRYERLRGATDFGAYLAAPSERSDEEVLTEPILAAIIERVLGFPTGAYFPQLGRSGLKPDFTPIDLIAHSFVLDAKSSDQRLPPHEPQIQRYITQRSLDYGVLFNLRELHVYRRGRAGHDPSLSFALLPLWRLARGEALPAAELAAFETFCERFAYRRMGLEDQIRHIRGQTSWAARMRAREPVEVDVEFLTERLRSLARTLVDDAAAQVEALEASLALRPGRERALLRELESLALDVSPGVDPGSLPATVLDWRTTPGLAERVWRQYLLRVAYLALTRILLYRAWEDVEFVNDYLYDGGFGVAYDRLSQNVRRVLDEAFLHGAERYHWLYGGDNNYDWYRPRDAALVEVLYSLAPVPLGRLDADVLGDLYASYVNEIDRDRLGQFYTPREVVRFMLDRAGFDGPDGVFRIEGDARRPRKVFDFATGSGGFLVEAARRIINRGGIAEDDARGLQEALAAAVGGLVGGEISPFPYYLTEVNLLLQVSRLLGNLKLAGEPSRSFALGVLHVDSLLAMKPFDDSLDVNPAQRADRRDLMEDERFGLIPLDGDKREAFRALRDDDDFDLVIGNPPYVAEANNKPLFDRLRAIPAWKGIYRGKTDYLYYFLLLAAAKVRPGGRLCVITPAGWMNAGAADFLRARLAAELRLDELFLFGSYRLFTPRQGQAARRRVPTPTVESAILVATKAPAPRNHSLRVVALEDEAAAARVLAADPEARAPDRDRLLAEMGKRVSGRAGRRDGMHAHRVKQAELTADRPWPVKHAASDLPARVVAHLQAQLDASSSPVEPLADSWDVFQGIQTGADAYTRRIQRRLTAGEIRALESAGAMFGDPVLELPPGAENEAPWSRHPEVLAKSPEPQALLYGAIDDDDYASLVVLGKERPAEDVIEKLAPWRPLLESRADIIANEGRKPWWAAHRARDSKQLRASKVIALYRTDRGRFSLDESGEWQPSVKTTMAVGRQPNAPVAYLCGLLNSELLDLWYAVRGKTPRDIWRNYEPKRMNEIPYRRPEGDPRAEEVARFVRLIAANRRALLPQRKVAPALTAIVKDPWRTDVPKIGRAALLANLPPAETVSVRLDGRLSCELANPPAGRPTRPNPETLVFRRGRAETGRIAGDPALLDLLEALVGSKVDDPGAIVLPKDLDKFSALARERAREIRELLVEGRELVEEVEKLVCSLYAVPADLTDEVIGHAIRRAGSGEAPTE